MFSSADLKNNLQTYLQSLWEMNCLKFIEETLGSASCNALFTTILFYIVLVCFLF
jgi:hypothetical protein